MVEVVLGWWVRRAEGAQVGWMSARAGGVGECVGPMGVRVRSGGWRWEG